MTPGNDKEHNPLVRLADSLTDDIMKASDEQILAEFSETGGDPVAHAAEMRAFVDKAINYIQQRPFGRCQGWNCCQP